MRTPTHHNYVDALERFSRSGARRRPQSDPRKLNHANIAAQRLSVAAWRRNSSTNRRRNDGKCYASQSRSTALSTFGAGSLRRFHGRHSRTETFELNLPEDLVSRRNVMPSRNDDQLPCRGVGAPRGCRASRRCWSVKDLSGRIVKYGISLCRSRITIGARR